MRDILFVSPQSVNVSSSNNGLAPLLIAVVNNDLPMVELLLEHGADIDAKNIKGKTALHHAAGHGLTPIVRALLPYKPDLSARYKGKTALERALDQNHVEIAELLEHHAEMTSSGP